MSSMARRAVAVGITLSVAIVAHGPASSCRGKSHETGHEDPSLHRAKCGLQIVGQTTVSRSAGVGSVDLHGDIAAVVQREEGIVALVDISGAGLGKVLGRFDNGAQDSLDGDVAFSDDGEWLFYARQTHQFSQDGIHVLDVSDATAPRETFYEAQGGTLRVAYYSRGEDEWVVSLDAVDGLVVHRFVRATGALVPVQVDSLPALKVGGPGSAGIFVDAKDPMTGKPLLYVTTGQTGLHVFDFSNPDAPVRIGAWDEAGLADFDVHATREARTIYAAREHWFDKSAKPEVLMLDARHLERIRSLGRYRLGSTGEDLWRVQGVERAGSRLYVSASHNGVLAFPSSGPEAAVASYAAAFGTPNENAPIAAAPYAMDLEIRRGHIFVTDGSSGTLSLLRRD